MRYGAFVDFFYKGTEALVMKYGEVQGNWINELIAMTSLLLIFGMPVSGNT